MRASEQVPPSWPQISFIQDLATISFPCAFRSRSLYRAASPAEVSNKFPTAVSVQVLEATHVGCYMKHVCLHRSGSMRRHWNCAAHQQ